MANHECNTTRRGALAALGAAAAIGVVPSTANAALTATVDRSTWDQELGRYQRIRAEFDRRSAAEEEACEAASRECPRVAHFFDKYALELGMDRKRAIRSATIACVIRDSADHLVLYPREKRLEQERQLAAIDAEAEKVADEFVAYQARRERARKTHNCDELATYSNDYRETFFAARDRIMSVPAPDVAALLVKIEEGIGFGDEYDDAIRDDAHRLLTKPN